MKHLRTKCNKVCRRLSKLICPSKSGFLFRIVILLIIHYCRSRLQWYYERTVRMNAQIDYDKINSQYDKALAEMIQESNGTGCDLPSFEQYSDEIMKHVNQSEPIDCDEAGPDWVKCYFSVCKLQPFVLATMEDVKCVYKDIIHINDHEYQFGPAVTVTGYKENHLVESDHMTITCRAWRKGSNRAFYWNEMSWFGYGVGLRPVPTKTVPNGRDHSINIFMLVLDSVSKERFVRKLPKSYKFIREKLNATCLDLYNVVGDGTHEAIIPMFTGKRFFELEVDARKQATNQYFDLDSLLFYKLNQYGYRTAYLEDTPRTGTFQYRYNGFSRQPTDHYLRSVFRLLENTYQTKEHCIGATKLFQLMLDLADQLTQLDGQKFTLCFISDVCHDIRSFELIGNMDDSLVELLESLIRRGYHKNTLIFIMGDHGIRYGFLRASYNGAMEERLPFMAIRLPETLKERLPEAHKNLEGNVKVLTTPHDIHTTLLDALDMPQYVNHYKVKGAILKRGLSLLKPIPKIRNCGDAGITSFWCTCMKWDDVPFANPMFIRVANAVVDYINYLTKPHRSICALRTLSSIEWVKKARVRRLRDHSYFNNTFLHKALKWNGTYKVKLTAGPGKGVFEGTVKHIAEDNSLEVSHRDMSRVSEYGPQARCIEKFFPQLNPYCFCTV